MTLSIQEIENANGPSFGQVDNKKLLVEFVTWYEKLVEWEDEPQPACEADVDQFLAGRDKLASR